MSDDHDPDMYVLPSAEDQAYWDAFIAAGRHQPDTWHPTPNGNEPETTEQQHTWHPINLADLQLEPPSPPTISRIIYPGRRHILSGEPESLKSWTMLAIASDQCRIGRDVLYVDFEMGSQEMLSRLNALNLDRNVIRDHFIYMEPHEPIWEAAQPSISALLETRKPVLVILDAMTGALTSHGYDPNSGRDVESFYQRVIHPFRQHDAAIVILDHLAKDKESRGKFAIGSERKIGGADVHLRFEVIAPFGRGKQGAARITTQKDRPGYLPRPKCAEVKFHSVGDTIVYEIAITDEEQNTGQFRPTRLMEKVSQFLSEQQHPASMTTIENSVIGKNAWIRTATQILIDEGYATQTDGPNRARLITSARPYHESDDPQVRPKSVPPPNIETFPQSVPEETAQESQ